MGSTQKGFSSWISLPRDLWEPIPWQLIPPLRKSVNQAPWCHPASCGQAGSLSSTPALAKAGRDPVPPRCSVNSSIHPGGTKPFVTTATAKIMGHGRKSGEPRMGEPSAELGSGTAGLNRDIVSRHRQSAHSTINNCWESLGSHRSIYFIIFPACWAGWIATQRHLCPSAGIFLPWTESGLLRGRWWLCSLPRNSMGWGLWGAPFWGQCGLSHIIWGFRQAPEQVQHSHHLAVHLRTICYRPGLNEVKTNMDLLFTTPASEGFKGGQNDRISDLLLAPRPCIHKGSC